MPVASANSSLGFLNSSAAPDKETYLSAPPFPHAVIDDFIRPGLLDQVLSEFPSLDQIAWRPYIDPHSVKFASSLAHQWGPATRSLLADLNSGPFIKNFLEPMTGIQGIIPDPHYWGGGLHQIPPGGKLDIHADFNRHPHLKLDRRINLLIYLNKDWKEEYNGHIELWNREMTRRERRLSPIFNRAVIFNTSDYSYHGHPQPLRCPRDRTRKSLALYYYTNGRPESEVSGSHCTLWQQPKQSL